MKKIIIFPLIILFFIKTQNVFGAGGTFTVDNIEVIGKVNEPNYRNKYLQTVFRSGFHKLISSIIKKEDQRELLSTDLKTIKSLISNYRVIDEQVIGGEYNLKAGITFDRKLVGKFLQTRNISYSEIKNLEIIIYPILIVDSELEVSSKNKFFEEWNEKKDFENISFILPVENLDDIDFIKKNLSILEEANLSRLVDNYEIKNSTILILRYDKKKLNVFLKTNLEGSKSAKSVSFDLKDLKNKEVRKDIIANLKYYINELWKEENLIDISAPSYLTVNTKAGDPTSLRSIIEKIKKIGLIESYTVERLDNESAKIKIKFFGNIKNLQNSFRENGFEFKILHDEWSLYLIS